MSLALKVECYSGYKADERPVRFVAQAAGAQAHEVKEVLDQWYGVGYRCFKVRAEDDGLYVLKHHEKDGLWTLESFRRDES
jgi:hypothetical protein